MNDKNDHMLIFPDYFVHLSVISTDSAPAVKLSTMSSETYRWIFFFKEINILILEKSSVVRFFKHLNIAF